MSDNSSSSNHSKKKAGNDGGEVERTEPWRTYHGPYFGAPKAPEDEWLYSKRVPNDDF